MIRIEFPYNGYFRHRSSSHLMLSWLKWEELKGRQYELRGSTNALYKTKMDYVEL